MKKIFTIVTIGCLLMMVQTADRSRILHSRASGAPAGHTGSPGDGKTCATIGCHAGPSATPVPGLITSNIPPTGYVPGQTYTLTASTGQAGLVKFGFQVSPQSATGAYLGTLQVTSPSTTQIVATKYITHTFGGTSGPSGSKTWSFDWVAPAAGTGDVTFYGAFNNTNNNGTSSGDVIRTSDLTVMEDVSTGIASADDPFKAVVYPVPANDDINIEFYLSESGSITIDMIDMSGSTVDVMVNNSRLSSGNHLLHHRFSNELSDGIYYLRIIGENGVNGIKKVLINK